MTGSGFPARLRISHQRRREINVKRRNGKLQSCEPCRQRKMRCDHMTPACGRCTRMNKPDRCVYHPAPLTNINSIPHVQATEIDHSNTLSSVLPLEEISFASPSAPLFTPPIGHSPETGASRADSLPGLNWTTLESGSLGTDDIHRQVLPDAQLRGDSVDFLESNNFISHDALLAESEASIGILPSKPESPPSHAVPQSLVERGAAVLSLLKDLPLFEKYIEKWFAFAKGVIIIEPMVKTWISMIWSTWHKTLESQSTEPLRKMSRCIWNNTTKPLGRLINQHTTPREFVTNTTGENLRWEVVGIIFTLVALLAQSLQDGDPIFCSHDDPPIDRAALAQKAYNASETCAKFCADFNIVNDLVLWHMYENTILATSLHPLGYNHTYTLNAHLSSALLTLHLHQQPPTPDTRTPFFLTQLRKRLFILAYTSDKTTSALLGLPPHLTRTYCTLPLPLDLTDTQLMSSDPLPQTTLQPCTSSQIYATNALLSEEILELALSPALSKQEIHRRATSLSGRITETYNQLPSHLHLNLNPETAQPCAPIELLFKSYIHLTSLQQKFQLQRLLIRKLNAPPQTLLPIAREIFKTTTQLAAHRAFLRDFQIDISEMLCLYGVPSAVVVAGGLLRGEVGSGRERSETIQRIAVFVDWLGDVRGCGGICERGKRVLKGVLEQVLEGPAGRGDGDMGDAGSEGEFEGWMESMGVERESWMGFS